MKIAEMFVNLGINGTEKTVGAIEGVKKGMGGLKDMSLEAKAALLAVFYAVGRLVSSTGTVGTGLLNLGTILGISTKQIQQYDYAARQMGMTNQDLEGSLKSLQGTMTKTLMGEGAPKGLGRVSLLVGGMSPEDINNYMKNPQKLLDELQKYALKEKNVGLRNEVLKSFGLSDSMIAALARGGFTPGVLAKAPTYSSGEINNLNQANIAWSNLGNEIEMAFGHFNALHGMDLVKDIGQITHAIIKLTEALVVLGDKLKVFKGLAILFDEAAKSINALTGVVEHPGTGKSWKDLFQHSMFGLIAQQFKSGRSTAFEINNHFSHAGVDPVRTGNDVGNAVKKAYLQQAGLGRGS